MAVAFSDVMCEIIPVPLHGEHCLLPEPPQLLQVTLPP
ncbi:hypothetical protein BN128_73 [Cronobacter sakazakii 696]|nr:hypothetical protein BN129_3898 [Cronobacter sakazakii 701]CCK06278.1 hypothetical protein BN128_73 [Cronobacter sakazakii 696]